MILEVDSFQKIFDSRVNQAYPPKKYFGPPIGGVRGVGGASNEPPLVVVLYWGSQVNWPCRIKLKLMWRHDQAVLMERSGSYKGQDLESLMKAGPSWVRQNTFQSSLFVVHIFSSSYQHDCTG